MRSNYTQTKLSQLEDFIKNCGFNFHGHVVSNFKLHIYYICNVWLDASHQENQMIN